MSHSNMPGWTVIRTQQDLLEHDPTDPAYLLVPPRLVPIVGGWLLSLEQSGPKAERARRFERRLHRLAAAPRTCVHEGRLLPMLSDDNDFAVADSEAPFPAGDGEGSDRDEDKLLRAEVGEDLFFEGDRSEEGDSSDLEDLWHDFSDELIKTGIVDSE